MTWWRTRAWELERRLRKALEVGERVGKLRAAADQCEAELARLAEMLEQ